MNKPLRQVLILSQDFCYRALLDLVINQFGFRARFTDFLEQLGTLSSSLPTIAWIIDLDDVKQTVCELVEYAKQKAPDARLVFLSSRFTREMAQECIRLGANALLIKPFPMERLIQSISSIHLEKELVEKEEMVPLEEKEHVEKNEGFSSGKSLLIRKKFSCPLCKNHFEAERFKIWVVPVSDTDTDFCPLTSSPIHPELYSVMVCPRCLFAIYVGQFERVKVNEKLRKTFLENVFYEERRRMTFGLNFMGPRTHLHGIKSFECAAITAFQLEMRNSAKIAGEYYLKASWLCRKMGNPKEEREYQEKALNNFEKAYGPYRPIEGKFPSQRSVLSLLPKGCDLLNERSILIVGFLYGELARRLKRFDLAEKILKEVRVHPALPQFTSLFHHINGVYGLLQNEMKSKSS